MYGGWGWGVCDGHHRGAGGQPEVISRSVVVVTFSSGRASLISSSVIRHTFTSGIFEKIILIKIIKLNIGSNKFFIVLCKKVAEEILLLEEQERQDFK